MSDTRARRWLTGLLYAAVTPVGIAVRVTRDPLRTRRPPRSNWLAARRSVTSLEEARRR